MAGGETTGGAGAKGQGMSAPSPVRREGEGFVVEAALLAEAFGLTEAGVRAAMRAGRIRSRCERGEGADAGRWRLTFEHAGRALRLVVDDSGSLLQRASFPVRPPPRDGGPR